MKQQNVTSTVHHIYSDEMICSIFSIPFVFDRLGGIGNGFPDIKFNHVTYLEDILPFKHQFFVRVARAFPLLRKFRICAIEGQSIWDLDNEQPSEIAVYAHLIYLDLFCASSEYIDQFLNEKKTFLPSLAKLRVVYNSLRAEANDFTRAETRRNCAKVSQLLINTPVACTRDFYDYFPLFMC